MRAVLDPNVIVSALLSPQGAPAKILSMWLGGAFELVISPKVIDETRRVLGYSKIRKRISEEEAGEAIHVLLGRGSPTEDPTALPSIRSSDPVNDYLIALAEASAAALVSGDSDLLELNSDLPIYSPRAFLELIRD